MAASEAAAIPFPSEETTPPVINIYLVMGHDDTVNAAFQQNNYLKLKAKTLKFSLEGLAFVRSLTMTYFHMRGAHYHWREVVSLSCSRWEGVGPTCYGRQT